MENYEKYLKTLQDGLAYILKGQTILFNAFKYNF